MEPDLIVLNIAGKKIEIPSGLLDVSRNTFDISVIPKYIFYYGELLACAQKQKLEIETEYRHWRATYSQAVVERSPKLSEWRVRIKVESTTEFKRFKEGLALADYNIATLKGLIDALNDSVTLFLSNRIQ